MVTFERISTDTWQLLIPSDWGDPVLEENGGFYFEAPDETKGFYITTWNSPDGTHSSNSAAIEHFSKTERSSIQNMRESSWEEISSTQTNSDDYASCEFDFFDSSRHYRITTRIIVSLPWISRLCFHDYLCEDFDTSTQALEPILKSFQLHHPAGT